MTTDTRGVSKQCSGMDRSQADKRTASFDAFGGRWSAWPGWDARVRYPKDVETLAGDHRWHRMRGLFGRWYDGHRRSRSSNELPHEARERHTEVIEQREASRAQRRVVEHRVRGARRRSRRGEVRRCGSGARGQGRRPASASTSRANSNQRTAPWLVTWTSPGTRSTVSVRIIAARSSVKVGHPRWSSTKARSWSCAAKAQHRLDHVRPVAVRRPTTCARSSPAGPGLAFAGELRSCRRPRAARACPTRCRARSSGRRRRSRSTRGTGGRRPIRLASAT